MKKLINVVLSLLLVFLTEGYSFTANAATNLISLFPIENYNQKIADWVSPSDPSYRKPLLTPAQQAIRKAELYRHYFGKESPWSAEYVNLLFSQAPPLDLKSLEAEKINSFSNQNQLPEKIGYGANFRPYPAEWLVKIRNAVQLQQFSGQHYHSAKRAIAITNIQGRVLPTDDPYFYSYEIAGEGYPFDNVQAAVIWAGTPLYILGETLDHAWSMVLTPGFIGWVKGTDIARVTPQFVAEWLKVAKKNMAAITHTQIAIIDTENSQFRFSGYIGMLFPAIKHRKGIEVLIPVVAENHQAQVHHAQPAWKNVTLVPLLPTPENFSTIIQDLLGRTYGWGSMYFYNDCSAELKNMYATFGIWLPTHSSNQADPQQVLGQLQDLSSVTPDANARSAYLMANAHRWMTVIYIGGHVLDYLGKYPNPMDPAHTIVPLSYQDMWGLSPKTGPARRAVVGQSVLFPLLPVYPEDPELKSQLAKNTFQLFYLDELPSAATAASIEDGSIKIHPHALLSP